MITRNELSLSLAQREYYPDLVFKADYMNKAARLPEWEVGVGVKVPLYFWRKQRYGVLEAAESVGEARNTRQSVMQNLLTRVKDLYVQARTAEQLTTLYQTAIIPQSRLSLESASAGYTVGKVDFLTLLNNVLVLREAELSYEEQLTEFEKSVAQLEEVVGMPLAGR
jgi:outer membrane protein TolC